MNLETRVGAFVLLGLVVAGFAMMKLGDISFKSTYTLYFVFNDVGALRDQSQIKISGVEIGRVHKIVLDKGRAKIVGRLHKSVPVFANARVRVKQTGIIGTQYLDILPGGPPAEQLKDGDSLNGEQTKTLNELVEKISELVEGKPGKPGLGDDLRATVSNLRNITDSLNAAIGQQKGELVDIVDNLHEFTVDLKGVASDVHDLTSAKKADIDASITRLRSILERLDDVMARVQRGEGAVGKLLSDKEMGEEVKKTVANVQQASESAKEVLNRFTKFRSYWELQLRVAPGANSARGDGGIRLQPRDHKYYYLGVNNAGNFKDEYKEEGDYEKKNTITAVIGKEFGPVIFELGALRSTAGIGIKYTPFKDRVAEGSALRWARNIEFNAQAFDFGRDETRGRAGRERKLDKPHVNVGAKYKLNRTVQIGAAVEDLAVLKQYNLVTHLIFEDRDLAYLFGFVSFAR